MTDKPDGTEGFVTFPVALSNYIVRTPDGHRQRIVRGIPQKGQEIEAVPPPPASIVYNGVWRLSSARDIQVHDWDFDDVKHAYDTLWPLGWRLHSLHVYARPVTLPGPITLPGDFTRYTAVWRQSTAAEIQLYARPFAEYKQRYDELWPLGWRLHILQTHVANGQELYTAVWRRSTVAETQVYGASYALYNQRYQALEPLGWRLHLLQAYVVDGKVRYNAVWRQSTLDEKVLYGKSLAEYRQRNNELVQENWRIHILQAYAVDGEVRYNAVWRPGLGSEVQFHAKSYTDFRRKYDELLTLGWRLAKLDVYRLE